MSPTRRQHFPERAEPAERPGEAPPSGGAPPSELARTEMARFVLGRGIAALGDQFLLFAVPLLVYKTTGSASKAGLVFLIEWLPRVFFLPVAGVVADRVGGYVMYLTADVSRALITFSAFIAVQFWPSGRFLTLSVMVALMALANAQAYVAMESSLPRFVARDRMVHAQATIQGTEQVSEVLGPVLAAVLATLTDTRALILVTSGVFALTAANVFFLRAQLRSELTEPGSVSNLRSITAGLRHGAGILRRDRGLLGLVGLTMTVNLMVGVGMATSAAITSGTFEKPDRYFGVLSSIAGIVAILTFFLVPRLARQFSAVGAILGSYVLICLGGLGVGQASTFPAFAVSYAVLIGMLGMFNVFIRAERIRRIPPEHLGKTIGLVIVLNQVSLPIAGFVVAVFARVHSPQAVVRGSVIASVAIAVLLLPLISKLRNLYANFDLAPNPV